MQIVLYAALLFFFAQNSTHKIYFSKDGSFYSNKSSHERWQELSWAVLYLQELCTNRNLYGLFSTYRNSLSCSVLTGSIMGCSVLTAALLMTCSVLTWSLLGCSVLTGTPWAVLYLHELKLAVPFLHCKLQYTWYGLFWNIGVQRKTTFWKTLTPSN